MVICHRGAAMRGCRLAGHNAAQSGFGGCARLLARSQVASWLPWLLAALVVLLWATYPTWFYAGLGAAATPGHALAWASVYVSVKMALFGGRWSVGNQRYRPLWAHIRSPLFWGGGLLFMTNAGLFNLSLSALASAGGNFFCRGWRWQWWATSCSGGLRMRGYDGRVCGRPGMEPNPAFYVAAVRDSEALMVFELGKLALTVGLACRPWCGGSMGMAGWQRSPWFWLSVWHGTVTLWFAIDAAYAGAGTTALILECWPLPAGLLLVWGRQGWAGLRASLTPSLGLAGSLGVAGVFPVVDGGSHALSAGAGTSGWLQLPGLERPAQPAWFLLGGGLILAGNLLALRRLL